MVFVLAGLVVDAVFVWMHERRWIFYEGLAFQARKLLRGRRAGGAVEQEGGVILVAVGDLPPCRYPERLNGWKQEHPCLRVTGMDSVPEPPERASHVVLVVAEEARPVVQSFDWRPRPGPGRRAAPRAGPPLILFTIGEPGHEGALVCGSGKSG